MGIDFGDFFNQAGEKAQAALDDLAKVGVPVLQASLEQWGIDTLSAMNKETTKTVNQNVAEMLAKSPTPGSLGAAVSATVQGSILNTYGLHIALGVAGLVVIGFMLRSK